MTIELSQPEPGDWLGTLRSGRGVVSANLVHGKLVVDLSTMESAPQVLSTLATAGQSVTQFSGGRADLASIFLSLTGRSLRDS